MAELPTVGTPTTTPAVALALADIEAATLIAGQDVRDCLDAVGDIIRIVGRPDAVFAWVIDTLGREHLNQFAARHRIKLHESRAVDEERLAKTVIIWTGQRPATTLLQLREEIEQRAEEAQRALDFQASVEAGHTEGVDAWHARTSKAAR
jgi:hypothetical protein